MKDMSPHGDGSAVIKVIGVGGGGGNAVRHMIESGIRGVDFICANTDRQALANIPEASIIQIGQKVTKGLGAGTNPAVGRDAAMEDREVITKALDGTDMVFITTGMGGGTGTGATPVIASIAKEMGILTIAVVTRPFSFEGGRRAKFADEGIRELSQHVDSLITIPNEKLMTLLGKDAPLLEAFARADDVLARAVGGISNLINMPGMMNVDFADVRAVMSEMGMALMGSGSASGPNRASDAASAAIHNPLLSNVDLRGARGFLVNITSGQDITLGEFGAVGSIIEEASENAIVKIGVVLDPSLGDEMMVTVVATGLDSASLKKEIPQHETQRKAPEYAQDLRKAPEYAQDLRMHSREAATHVKRDIPAHEPMVEEDHEEEYFQASNFTDQPHRGDARRDVPMAAYNRQNEGRERVTSNRPINARGMNSNSGLSRPHNKEDLDYMDIPAFLRRKDSNY